MDAHRPLRLATRGSELALWQTQWVSDLLAACGVASEIVVFSTAGDRDRTSPLAEIGGKGVFVAEIQRALLDGQADAAVHSAKDMPAASPPGLSIGAFLPRADPRDTLVGCALVNLPTGATVATGSPRRRVQLLDLRPDLNLVDIRGNIGTRLAALDADDGPDAVMLTAAALDRVADGGGNRVVDRIDVSLFTPQVGQAIVAVECRDSAPQVRAALDAIDDPESRACAITERAFLESLGGDCSIPAGAHATMLFDGPKRSGDSSASGSDPQPHTGPRIRLRGVLGADGERPRRAQIEGTNPIALGTELAETLLNGFEPKR